MLLVIHRWLGCWKTYSFTRMSWVECQVYKLRFYSSFATTWLPCPLFHCCAIISLFFHFLSKHCIHIYIVNNIYNRCFMFCSRRYETSWRGVSVRPSSRWSECPRASTVSVTLKFWYSLEWVVHINIYMYTFYKKIYQQPKNIISIICFFVDCDFLMNIAYRIDFRWVVTTCFLRVTCYRPW